ncbi:MULTISPECIES: TolC family protein [Pacificimonas]|uniref:TolC family protein n=1 Tax=Pacificimonas aurantium TaxID=1250540 RepID=A0ABS7WJ25_9SPHN|nr:MULTISPECIES: TolC family protein [Pacificimonas]MBZ6378399.1 TolC family protein [Pacificimonas aurantium]
MYSEPSGTLIMSGIRLLLLAASCFAFPSVSSAQEKDASIVTLPKETGDPMALSAEGDPVLSLGLSAENYTAFRDVVASAVARNPSVEEALAGREVARAQKDEARAGLYPDVIIALAGRETIDREFSNDPDNVLERSRSLSRYDASFNVDQTILDFGATSARIEAGTHRIRSAALEVDAQAERVALAAVASWYDVFAYRALVDLSETFLVDQRRALAEIEERIAGGVNAPGDLARAESSIALTAASLARYRRQLAGAEARFTELIGRPPPPGTLRAPDPDVPAVSVDMAEYLARVSPPVEAAREEANAVYDESRAAKAERYPTASVGVRGGYYGLFDEAPGDSYDIRAEVTVQQEFFTGRFARSDAQKARADAAFARAEAVEEEAAREAAIAWADVRALDAELTALAENYMAARRTRDVLAERFRYARGTLFDVLQAEDTYFSVAGRYIQTLTERDAARYVLLARTGRLLDALGIERAGPLNGRN